MLPIMAKINIILKSECGNTWEFRHSLGKELKVMMILALKNIFIFAYQAADIEDCSFLAGNSNDFKVTSWRVFEFIKITLEQSIFTFGIFDS